MRLLVIGGTGFLSGTVVREALSAGHQVTIVTRGRRPVPPGVEALLADRGDTASVASVLAGREFDAAIDCIGFRKEDAEQDLDPLPHCTERLVFISTDFVYGGEPRRLPLTEDAPTSALNQYGLGKRECETRLLSHGSGRGLAVTVLRPPHILGAGSHLGTGSLQGRDPMLLDRLRRGVSVVLLDGGALLIQPVCATDVAVAALAVLEADASVGGVYNIAGPEGVTTRRYYEQVAGLIGSTLRVLSMPSRLWVDAHPDRAPFAQHRLYSTDALTRDSGFAPSISLDAMLQETISALEETGAAQLYAADPRESALIVRLQSGEAELSALLAPE
jgi:nucleoside-diphosphate-sugar epimerase